MLARTLSVSHARANKFKTTVLSQIFFLWRRFFYVCVCVAVCMFKESHSGLHNQSSIGCYNSFSIKTLKRQLFSKDSKHSIKNVMLSFLSVCVCVCLSLFPRGSSSNQLFRQIAFSHLNVYKYQFLKI